MKQLATGFAVLVILGVTACSKEPGEGGRAEIQGRLLEQRYNSSGQPSGQPYPLADTRVYIIYGDGAFHDDDTRTGPDGRFRFPYLRKGVYTVYAISECEEFQGCTTSVNQRATIDARKAVVVLPDMTVKNL